MPRPEPIPLAEYRRDYLWRVDRIAVAQKILAIETLTAYEYLAITDHLIFTPN